MPPILLQKKKKEQSKQTKNGDSRDYICLGAIPKQFSWHFSCGTLAHLKLVFGERGAAHTLLVTGLWPLRRNGTISFLFRIAAGQ